MAYGFSGATHVIRRGDYVAGALPITMFARFRLPTLDSLEHCLIGLFESTIYNGHRLQIEFTGGTLKARIAARDGGGASSATTTTSVSDTNWHSVIGIAASTTSRSVYLDNAGLGTNAVSKVPGTLAKTIIGAQENNAALLANLGHQVADAAVWATGSLTTEERQALTDGYSPLLIKPHLLRIYVPLVREPNDALGGAFTITGATFADNPRKFEAA